MSLSLLEIFGAVVVGYIIKLLFPKLGYKLLSSFLLYVLSPLTVFYAFQKFPFNLELFNIIILYFFVGVLTLLICLPALKVFKRKEQSLLKISCLNGNTGSLGIPLCIYIFGEQAISHAIVMNLTALLLVFSIGIYCIARGESSFKNSIAGIFKLPVIYAAIIAIILTENNLVLSPNSLDLLAMIAKYGFLLGLTIIGISLASFKFHHFDKKLLSGAFLTRSLVSPLLALLIIFFLPFSPLTQQIFVFQRAMPIAIVTAILGTHYDVEPEKASMLVVFSTLSSIIVFPFWYYVIKAIFVM